MCIGRLGGSLGGVKGHGSATNGHMDGLVVKGESVLAVGQGLLANPREESLLRVSKEIQRNDAKRLTYISLLVDGHQTVAELSTLSLVEVVGNIIRLASDNAQVGAEDSLLGGRGIN